MVAHDGRPPLEKDREIRVPWDLLQEAGVTAGVVRVYGAIRSRVGFEPAAENFLLAWPRVETIAKEAGVSRYTVSRATDWLEERDYLLIWRRPNEASTYGVVVHRDHFRRFAAAHGRAEAIDDWRLRRAELAHDSRAGQAKAASENRKPHLARISARKPHACNMPVEMPQAPGVMLQGSGSPCSAGAASDVAGMRHGSVDQLNCDPGNRGSAVAELPLPPHTPERAHSNGNGQAPTIHRCAHPGNLKTRYSLACAGCQAELWRDRFYAPELRKLGLRPPAERGVAL